MQTHGVEQRIGDHAHEGGEQGKTAHDRRGGGDGLAPAGIGRVPAIPDRPGPRPAALAERPTKMALAGQLVNLYQTYLQTVTAS